VHVPEAAVDIDDLPEAGKNDVRRSGQIAAVQPEEALTARYVRHARRFVARKVNALENAQRVMFRLQFPEPACFPVLHLDFTPFVATQDGRPLRKRAHGDQSITFRKFYREDHPDSPRQERRELRHHCTDFRIILVARCGIVNSPTGPPSG
jgi:hypothetical protein